LNLEMLARLVERSFFSQFFPNLFLCRRWQVSFLGRDPSFVLVRFLDLVFVVDITKPNHWKLDGPQSALGYPLPEKG